MTPLQQEPSAQAPCTRMTLAGALMTGFPSVGPWGHRHAGPCRWRRGIRMLTAPRAAWRVPRVAGDGAGLIGRDGELARLGGLVDPPPARSQVLVLLGDAGAGKTVLLGEVARRA